MSVGQLVAPAAGIGQTVVPYATFQAAFQKDPGQLNDAVQTATATASGGDPAEQQRLVAAWHEAIGALSQDAKPIQAKGGDGAAIMRSEEHELAARLQTDR